MIADVSQAVRQVVRTAMGMPANSVMPANQLAGAGTETQHVATVNILSAPDVGWPATTYENVDGTKTSPVNEHVDQLKAITVSVNFYRGGNADSAGLAQWTLRAPDDAARVAQLMKTSTIAALLLSLGLTFVSATPPRDLTGLVGQRWKSRGQVDLTFYVVNRESVEVNSIGSGTIKTTIGPVTKTTEVTT